MSDDSEQEMGRVKRRKIVHWNPEETHGSPPEKEPKKKSKKTIIFIGGGLLIAIAIILFIPIPGLRETLQDDDTKATQEALDSTPLGTERTKYRFVSRERVDRFRAEANSALEIVKKLTDEHETLLRKLLVIENDFELADKYIDSGSYPQAMEVYDRIQVLIEEFKALIALKEQATTRYDEFLVLIEENEKIRMLAPFEFEIAVKYGEEGRNAYEAGIFNDALNSFTAGIGAMKTMENKIITKLSVLELNGKKALSSGDKDTAITLFEDILRLQPDIELASNNLTRAQTIDQVYPLLGKAEIQEKKGNLDEALVAYEEAFEIDPLSIKAQQGKYRLAKTIKDNKYDQLLEYAESAVEDKSWDEAIKHYEAAYKVYPDRTDPKDAIAKTKELKRQYLINDALDRARYYENEYDWYKARDAYQEVLDIESGHDEATEGLVQAGKIIRAILRFENFLEIAEEKAASGEYQEAIRDFNAAMALKPDYLSLDDRARGLQKLLKDQSRPSQLVFASDGQTWVSVSGYKMLGKFKGQQTESFLPGNYIVRGRRKGYQEVIYEVRVRSGRDLPIIEVVCNERM